MLGVADDDGVVLAAVGTSDLVRGDVSLGRADAEADARNQVATQLGTWVRRVVARTSEAMRDHETGQVLGQTVVSDVSEQVTEMILSGTRPVETYYSPDRENPRRVYVRLVVAFDPEAVASQIAQRSEHEARRRRMQLRHDELLRSLRESVRALDPRG
ncbi:MAG: hypothetical protein HYY06_26015 [Deltaproteobacteria bacterium]|nr:hypothetical protein [Deltaproteobacteria bacterium]